MSPAAFRTWQPYYCWREFLLFPRVYIYLYYSPGWMDRQRELFLNGRILRGWLQMQMADVPLRCSRHLHYDRIIIFLKNATAGRPAVREMDGWILVLPIRPTEIIIYMYNITVRTAAAVQTKIRWDQQMFQYYVIVYCSVDSD